jgi:hypothetical protein
VHLQKNRPGPSAALFQLARRNLVAFVPRRQQLDIGAVVEMIDQWLARLQKSGHGADLLTADTAPKLALSPA